GFTLIELMIGMVLITILVGAIGESMIVSFRTTGVTNHRLAESDDVLIVSSYLANDVQSAAAVNPYPGVTANCSAAFTNLVTFTYPSGKTATYQCGTATNGQTQITRTFGSGSAHILAHYSGTARPNVQLTY